jgi:hypothetical protein
VLRTRATLPNSVRAGIVAAATAWLVACATPAAARPERVRLIEAAPSRVAFSVDVPPAAFSPHAKDAALTEVALEGYDLDGLPGEPGLPIRVVLVAVPAVGEVRVTGRATPTQVIEGALLAPIPTIESGDPIEAARLDRSAAVYAARGSRAPERARLLDVSWMRNQRVARVAILPVDYDPALRRATATSRVDVEVSVALAAPTGEPKEPRDPFEDVYRQTLVNYEQGRSWRRAARERSSLPRLGGLPAASPQGAIAVPETTVFAGRSWVKIAITKSGFYKVRYGDVRTFQPFANDTVPIDSLRLFTWPGFPVLPETNYCDSCDFREVAMRVVDGGGDGDFSRNLDDYFEFYAEGPSGWADEYDAARGDTTFINHPYTRTNFYYLTVATAQAPVGAAPRRIGTRPGAPVVDGDEIVPATFPERAHFELDSEYFPDSSPFSGGIANTLFWEKFFWVSLSQGRGFDATGDAPGADVSQPARLRAVVWGVTSLTHRMEFSFNGAPFATRAWFGPVARLIDTTVTNLQVMGNVFRPSVPAWNPGQSDRSALAWFDLHYARRLEPVNDSLNFVTRPAAAAPYLYRVGPFTSPTAPLVYDVTDPLSPVEITGVSYAAVTGGFQLEFESFEPGVRRYRVLKDAQKELPPLGSITQAQIFQVEIPDAPGTFTDNLRSPTLAADYLVLYFDGFKVAADSLVAWRRTRLPLAADPGPYEAMAVPVSACFDQFAGGRTDPAAVRNFLRAAFTNWRRAPAFVTFLGDASYDFKNIQGRAPAGLPGTLMTSYEGGWDVQVQRQFATDDWMLNVDNAAQIIPDFFGGRMPAGDAASANAMVRNKVLAYERSAPFGEYRNRFILVGDDNMQGESPDPLNWTHMFQTVLLDTAFTTSHVDREYVYLHTYPYGPGFTKPGAKADLKRGIDEGAALFNYIGHGSPFKIADESVMLDTDVGTLANGSRLTAFVAASCDVGKYNDPTVLSLGERLLVLPTGGSMAVISATELALSSQNAQLNRTMFAQMFVRDSAGTGQYRVPFSEALLKAKVGSLTTQKYQVMGDAAVRLNLPEYWVEMSFEDSTGAPITQVERGQTVVFRGRVLDRPGGSAVPIDGVAALLIEDSPPLELLPVCFQAECFFYRNGGVVFRGDAGITSGAFAGRFIVPLEARTGPRMKARAYVTGRAAGASVTRDAVGDLRATLVGGTGPAGDNEGPRIALSFEGGATSVRPDATLRVDLFDPSGILTTGHAPANAIIVTVDDNSTNRTDITESFRYAADGYQAGTAFFPLPNLSLGPHRIRVSAADNLAAGLNSGAHRSSAEIEFVVEESPKLTVARAYLFPSPTTSDGGPRSGGTFIVDAPGDSVNALLRVYTVAGKMIREFKAFGARGQVQIPWNGLDDEGFALANGVYLFRVHVNVRDPDGRSSARQHATADGRFTIVNP